MAFYEIKNQQATLETIRERVKVLEESKVTLGFDGFIDSVVKVVEQKDQDDVSHYFESTRAFGEYIVEKGQKSFSIELEEQTTKLGGNMPIMANALARLGAGVSCIGPLGYPEIHPIFTLMKQCHLYSFGNPGLTKVLEFNSGKIMMAEMNDLNDIPWEFIRDTVGAEKFCELITNSDLIAILNWSELDNSTAIWRGLLRDILDETAIKRKPIGFFDLSDCSKRQIPAILEAMKLIIDFGRHWDVILSLNLNEATIIHTALTGESDAAGDINKMCNDIFDRLRIKTVIIHSARQALARDCDGVHIQKSFFIEKPTISSGAGDNFNAGFAAGTLMNLSTAESLLLGNATSALYMKSANSPSMSEIIAFLSQNLSTWAVANDLDK
jgi:sugar/nucleoside kinase (ribokinase family)